MLTLTLVRCSVRPHCSAMPMKRCAKTDRRMGSQGCAAASEAAEVGDHAIRGLSSQLLSGGAVGVREQAGGGCGGAPLPLSLLLSLLLLVLVLVLLLLGAAGGCAAPAACAAVSPAASACGAASVSSSRMSPKGSTCAVQPGSTTTVQLLSTSMAGPVTWLPSSAPSWYSGACTRPRPSK